MPPLSPYATACVLSYRTALRARVEAVKSWNRAPGTDWIRVRVFVALRDEEEALRALRKALIADQS